MIDPVAGIDPAARVHPSADVEDGVSVGAGSAIWQRAQVRSGARIGADCIVGRDAFIDGGVEIGDRTKIQNAALIYHGVTIADGVFIGPGAILTNDRYPRAITADGDLARAADWELSPIHIEHGAGAVVTRPVPGHALVAGNPAKRIGWVCACGARLLDGRGDPAPAEIERYASNPELTCPRCGRRYRYEADEDTLREVAR